MAKSRLGVRTGLMLALSAMFVLAPPSLVAAQDADQSSTEPVETERLILSHTRIPRLKHSVSCDGVLKQGGLAICRTLPNTRLSLSDGRPDITTDEDGIAVIGLSRKAPPQLTVTSHSDDAPADPLSTRLEIAPRKDKVTEVRGVPCDRLDSKKRTPAQQKNIERSWLLKQAAWKSFNQGPGAKDGFVQPAKGRISSKFGGYRTYITTGCETRNGRPHFGYDIAAPTGSPIVSPADGVVTLADDDLFFEGGTVFIDHGHGLTSIFLHMSKVDVTLGDTVKTGELLGEVGSTGTATGPHLHWGVKYRNPNSSDRSGDFYIDPELLLELPKIGLPD